MDAADFWIKIKRMLSEKGKTQEWLCNEIGLDLQSMRNRIYKNRFPSIEEALKILAVFNISAEEFFGISIDGLNTSISKNVMLIPVMDQVFSAGHGQYVPDTEEITEYVAVPNDLKKYGNLAASKVRGDSMEPTLYDNDTIICDNKGYDGTDGVYVIHYKGKGFVKRLQYTGDGIKIISDNPKYEPMSASNEQDEFSVIGKVRCIIHRM